MTFQGQIQIHVFIAALGREKRFCGCVWTVGGKLSEQLIQSEVAVERAENANHANVLT